MAELEDEILEETVEGNESSAWIFTFADMMTLILTFFVLMFSMSKIELERFKAVMSSIQSSFGEFAPSVDRLHIPETSKQQDQAAEVKEVYIDQSGEEEKRARAMLDDIIDFIARRGMSDHIMASVEGANIILRVKDTVFFVSGRAKLSARAKSLLDDMVVIFRKYIEYRIKIAGHTDNVPINTPQFPSNWELSAIRATTVLRHILNKGVDVERVTATGYGEQVPLVPNDSTENRAINRRVEFVLEKQN